MPARKPARLKSSEIRSQSSRLVLRLSSSLKAQLDEASDWEEITMQSYVARLVAKGVRKTLRGKRRFERGA